MSKERHIKGKRKETWSSLRIEIEYLCKELNISDKDFSSVNINHWQEIENNIWSEFSSDKKSVWIWNSLKVPYSTLFFDNIQDLDFKLFVPSDEKVWFLLNESVNLTTTKFWIYKGYIDVFEKIFWESEQLDEILIVSKKYEWILVLNHHDILIGTGKMKNKIDLLLSK